MPAKQSSQKSVSAILLAAGMSQRMGDQNKLHLPVGGKSLLRRNAELFLEAGVKELVVVLGHEHQRARETLANTGIRCVVNENYQDGQMTSVHAGLTALSDPDHAGQQYDGVIVALADQPALEPEHIQDLIEVFSERGEKSVVVPHYRGQRGNPIVLDATASQRILAGQVKLGCRKFIDNNPDSVMIWNTDEPAFVLDLDTPEQYQAFVRGEHQAQQFFKSTESIER